MTIKQITNQLFDTSVAGYFNGEKFTKQQLEDYLNKHIGFNKPEGNSIYMMIALQDGWWLFTVSYIPSCLTYGYYIPETREQEEKLKQNFEAKIARDRKKEE